MEIYDLHSHILPDLIGDDGSNNIETSKQMLEQAFASGTRHIVATPHVIELHACASWQEIQDQAQALQAVAPSGLKVYPGTELMLNWDLLELYKEQGAYSLNGSRYALVELPMFEVPRYAEDFFFEMQILGRVPVLAHPERYAALWEQPDRLLTWLKKGVLLQINAGSLLGKYGGKAKVNAELLLKNKVVTCIGSDAHSAGNRNPNLSAELVRLEELVGERYNELTNINPKKILANEAVEMHVPQKLVLAEEKKSFWSKLFG